MWLAKVFIIITVLTTTEHSSTLASASSAVSSGDILTQGKHCDHTTMSVSASFNHCI